MGRIAGSLLAVAIVISWPGTSFPKTPWEQLMGRKPKVWNDPAGRFLLDLPVGWEAHAEEDNPVVSFVRPHPDTGLVAHAQVEMRSLPPQVQAAHFDAHIQADNKKRAPGYTVLDRAETKVSGVAAIQTLFRYRARGNAELTREVVQTVFVVGERGFILTLETIAGTRGVFWEEFELMLEGFSAQGRTPQARSKKGRRRIRAGEMIHPDAVGY